MVGAILAGHKSQTRRVIKPQPVQNGFGKPGADTDWEIPCYEGSYPPSAWLWPDEHGGMLNGDAGSPWHGVDRLWVKETFSMPGGSMHYRADEIDHSEVFRWTPSIFMPRWASRITLEITDVCAERLLSITEADAIAEGVRTLPAKQWKPTWRETYLQLWDDINGKGNSALNQFVWRISFRMCDSWTASQKSAALQSAPRA